MDGKVLAKKRNPAKSLVLFKSEEKRATTNIRRIRTNSGRS
jgi:hypothetical protein